ncbi:hypothetical protein MC7420_5688 [Coleofasciculus chthonoplastes PCC 7420]|uniref:Uncharacterized protein n=1 Tax=Coleofasciculus chthonoplastes PCC 7420 TaxID=118168 RepID=B4VPA0_9CYAN|nr:hypothetical protein MC7420_5688 [Coleofasciculus chthonoplastes PCC 7420]
MLIVHGSLLMGNLLPHLPHLPHLRLRSPAPLLPVVTFVTH